ncbi:MAG: alpha/beta hydrolase family protein [Oscillospiraceae bacterium]|nr:alpha/beta hydrolase family protein [Oscillospiraceae bacterium]
MYYANQNSKGETFYTSIEQMKALFRKGCKNRFTGNTESELKSWQKENRKLFSQLLGFDTFEPCKNEYVELERVELDKYTRVKYLLQTEEMVYVPSYLLLPNDIKPGEKRPVIIAAQGHFKNFKDSVAGVTEHPGVVDDMTEFNITYGVKFAEMGYIVFCPDARGFGERAEYNAQEDGRWRCTCKAINYMGIPLGRCAIGMSVWDLTKLIDYIHTRPDCDVSRIGAAGLSGGGLQSLYLAAVDERIKCTCTSGYFYGALESLLVMNDNCDCNYVPDLWTHFDMGDIASLIAPRALIIETGTKDGLNGASGVANVTAQLDIAKKAYDVCNSGDKVKHTTFDDGHKWNGTDVYPFFEKNL